jgi:hypothetical protein
MIGEVLNIPVSTVYLYFITSLNMKSRHFKWVPHFSNDDLRAKRSEGPEEPLDLLKSQDKWHFRDLITGSKTRIDPDMKSRTI